MNDFLENNTFKKIKKILFDTNIFSILKFDTAEIRHTNMIEWLLSLDNYRGLKEIIKQYSKFNLDIENINNITFYNDKPFKVLFESDLKERPDLLIHFTYHNEEYNILIENKINAFENEYEQGNYQTKLYYDEMKRLNLSDKTLFIFLDAKDNDPKCDEYTKLNYNNFYNNIIKKININSEDEEFILRHYITSLMRPMFDKNDILLDTIYVIDKDIPYESVYSDFANNYIKEHANDTEKDDNYLTLKYIYYCINEKNINMLPDDIKDILFGKKRQEYNWKYNGVSASKIDIVKQLCRVLYQEDQTTLKQLFDVKVSSDNLLCTDIMELSKNNEAWKVYLENHKDKTIDDYYDKLYDDLYVRSYITNDVMLDIYDRIKDTKYKDLIEKE